ncbi:MAG: tRNA (adenosine(37)-N6)-threonylcarbamoyltransferase complex dimerization subunit type 1 TsaB [Thermoguttaceae bacterium]
MKILALETTEKIGTVAAVAGGKLLGQLALEPKLRSAQSLIPAMHQLMQTVHWTPQDVQLVAVSVGPGSFTGLRVGVTAAKVFAYCVGAAVLGVSTLETIAAGALEPEDAAADSPQHGPAETAGGRISVVLDAQRGDVVAQCFASDPEHGLQSLGPEELVPAEQWLASLTPGLLVAGPVLGRLRDRLPAGVLALPPERWPPRAAVVGRLAARYYDQGRRDDLWKLAPRYFRRSAAEEKWEAMGR